MKILKELSRKEFRSKLGSKELFFLFLCEVKWSKGFSCFKCNTN
jgi:hypothetical protein